MKNSPSMLDAAPIAVPRTTTLAPIRGSLVLESIIFPFSEKVCSATRLEKMKIIHNFISFNFNNSPHNLVVTIKN